MSASKRTKWFMGLAIIAVLLLWATMLYVLWVQQPEGPVARSSASYDWLREEELGNDHRHRGQRHRHQGQRWARAGPHLRRLFGLYQRHLQHDRLHDDHTDPPLGFDFESQQ